jgi:hypothetical protein
MVNLYTRQLLTSDYYKAQIPDPFDRYASGPRGRFFSPPHADSVTPQPIANTYVETRSDPLTH